MPPVSWLQTSFPLWPFGYCQLWKFTEIWWHYKPSKTWSLFLLDKFLIYSELGFFLQCQTQTAMPFSSVCCVEHLPSRMAPLCWWWKGRGVSKLQRVWQMGKQPQGCRAVWQRRSLEWDWEADWEGLVEKEEGCNDNDCTDKATGMRRLIIGKWD